ncbi:MULTISPECIES: type III toxin-antitoxin system ToxN/AbiQ family toxin [Fusobacterium]|uniref:type III toxin-antitoxin system ToxN/AbiQ family toxin n=1 Tax=Fusobacterium TaxID=848 RepID=UPI001EEF8959|nr:type III toxin-antitoxin system ToxN/AbiQ family toxin [Fusobacterium nucleatum]MCG6845287.1 type III toxin-antitoxin system ToxN/AbiQ family toxin [Fusobacterium nucleatum]
MIWCTINKDYISFLKNYDSRIPNIDYGNNGYKPFFSPLFEKDGLVYVTQISSKKPRHLKMKESIDFVKIFDKTNKKLISVINLNYMFPVPKSEIIEVKYKNIDNFRTFSSLDEKNKYINLLKYEMKVINNKNIQAQALKVYNSVNTDSFLKNRSLSFLLLEEKAIEYSKEKQYNCLTGNLINIELHSSGENKWIAKKDIEKFKIEKKDNAKEIIADIYLKMSEKELKEYIKVKGKEETKNLSDEEKLYQIPITYYNISDLKITKEIEQKFVPMKEKEKSQEIEKLKGQGIGD